MHKQFIALFFLSITLNGYAQKLTWERFYGGTRTDEITTVFENRQGELIALGKTKSKNYKKEDVLFRILNQQGEVKLKHNFGGRKDDGANAAIPLLDGAYLVAGFTQSKWEDSKGKQDAWLVKIDEGGEPLWNICLGTASNDEFYDLIQLPDGHIVAVGTASDNHLYAVKINEWDGSVIWEKRWKDYKGKAKGVAFNNQQEIVLTGATENEEMFFCRLNESTGALISFKVIADTNLKGGNDIVFDNRWNEYLIAGMAFYGPSRRDMALVKLNASGNLEWQQRYGGRNDDVALKIMLTPNNHYLLAGHTKSHIRGARRRRGYLLELNRDGNKALLSGQFIGGKQTDLFLTVANTSNGDILAAGTSNSNSGLDRDAWMVKVKNGSFSPTSSTVKLTAEHIEWKEEIPNDTLDAEERSYISFKLFNPTQTDLTGLSLEIQNKQLVKGIKISEYLNIERLPQGAFTTLSIPIQAAYDVASGANEIAIRILNGNGKEVGIFDFSFTSKAQPLPLLKIIGGEFISNYPGELLERKEPIQLHLKIVNAGNAVAETVGSRFFLPKKVDAINETVQQVGDLNPGDTTTIILEFKIRSYYEYDSLNIRCLAFEKSMRQIDHQSFGVKIRNFYDIPEAPNIIIAPKNNRMENSSGGPLAEDYFEIEDMRTKWYAPDPDFEGYSHKLEENYIPIQVRVYSPIELEESDFVLWINGKEAIDGETMDMNFFGLNQGSSFDGTYINYAYTNKVLLKEGTNTIILKVRSETEWVASPPMEINYKVDRPNLHIYAFGVPYQNEEYELKFTQTDAESFVKSFEEQEGRLFDKIRGNTYNKEEETTANEMKGILQDEIYNDYTIRGLIDEDDAILIYFAAHGFLLNNDSSKFRIAASDFSFMRQRSKSIDFQEDVLASLNELEYPSKKYLFIDACHSGAIANEDILDKTIKDNDDPKDNAMSNAVARLAKAGNTYNMLVSCGPNQKSYENSEWGNGAFTKAIIEAFSGKGVEGTIPDKNIDGVLDMKELYEYVQIRVPNLVKGLKPTPSPLQTPYMPKAHLEDNLPIFSLE